MAEIQLYSMAVCPFAQRARMTLAMKSIEYELMEIDISKPRPAWFHQVNPLGKVPVIRHGDRLLNESSVICEYLEDAFPKSPTCVPRDPYTRALARILVDHANQKFVPAMYRLLMNQDRAQDTSRMEDALASWRFVDEFLMRHNPAGTYLDDADGFSLAEINFAPFFQRYCLNDHYRGFRLPEDGRYDRVRRYRDACLAEPLVQRTGMPDEDFIKLYFDYSLGFGDGKIPPGRERSSFDLDVPLADRPLPPGGGQA